MYYWNTVSKSIKGMYYCNYCSRRTKGMYHSNTVSKRTKGMYYCDYNSKRTKGMYYYNTAFYVLKKSITVILLSLLFLLCHITSLDRNYEQCVMQKQIKVSGQLKNADPACANGWYFSRVYSCWRIPSDTCVDTLSYNYIMTILYYYILWCYYAYYYATMSNSSWHVTR